MPQIVLTDDQAELLAATNGPIEVVDAHGRVLALLQPEAKWLAEAIEEGKRRLASPEPGIPSERVQAMLRKLNELDRQGTVTQLQVNEVVDRVLAGHEP